jgi:hypothetical protein
MFWLLRPAYYLRVETAQDVRKIVFRGHVQHRGLEELLQRANRTGHYRITSALPGFDLPQ